MLTSLTQLKRWLNVGVDEDDELLSRLGAAASTYVENWIGRQLLHHEHREQRLGHGSHALLLAHYPPQALLAISIDGQQQPVAGFCFQGRQLLRIQGVFARGSRIELHYEAGYTQVPADLEQAVIDLVALRYRERDRIGHQSKSLAGETVTFFIGELSPAARSTLIHYRDVVPL